jgi:hypothetical protein
VTQEQEFWERANNIFTLITQRDDTDSWRRDVIRHLVEVHTDGYWEGRS